MMHDSSRIDYSSTLRSNDSLTLINEEIRRKKLNSGYVEAIELFDFMCHRHLLIRLNPGVNFIVGNNGSGKSAILTGLIIALGSRAGATQRAASIESLVREGASASRVKVKLYNGGNNPFAPDIYGEHIIVERCIRRGGSGSYHIYNSNNRLVTSRKEDISLICDHFGIQVDNPLAVLTQEVAKKFLANARPKELYEFFLKATQLEQLGIDYMFTEGRILDSKIALERSKHALGSLLDTIRCFEKELLELEKLRQAHQRVQQLREELTWALVNEHEQELKALIGNLQKRERLIEELQSKLNSTQDSLDAHLKEVRSLEGSIVASSSKLDPFIQQRVLVANELRLIEKSIAELEMDANNINEEFTVARQQLEENKSYLEARFKGTGPAKKIKLLEALERLENEMISLNQELGQKRDNETSIDGLRNELNEYINKVREKGIKIERIIQMQQSSLMKAEGWKNNRIKAYGDNMPAALSEIKRQLSKFSQPPVGPVGLYIKVVEPKWSLALEAIIQSNMETFVVNCHNDRVLLSSILQSKGLKNPIVVLRFEGDINYQSGLPDKNFKTPLDVMSITNPVVKKLLILMTGLESIALIENRSDAVSVARSRPRNINAIYTATLRISAGLNTVSIMNLYIDPKKSRIAEDLDRRLEDLRKQLSRSEEELENLKKEDDRTRQKLTGLSEDYDVIVQDVRELEGRIGSKKAEIRKVKEDLDREKEIDSDNLYEREKMSLTEKVETLRLQFQVNENEMNSKRSNKNETISALNEIERQINEIKKEREFCSKELVLSSKKRRELERELEDAQAQLTTITTSLAEEQNKVAYQGAQLAHMKEAASKLCPPVETKRPVGEIDAELTTYETVLQNISKATKDPILLREEIELKRREYHNAEHGVVVNGRVLELLSHSLKERERAWIEFRRSISKMSCTDFVFMMSSRGFVGSLDYRHQDSELYIRVTPQLQAALNKSEITAENDLDSHSKRQRREVETLRQHEQQDGLLSRAKETRDVKQLSGGEKSYSTACFLFSLWQTMGSPFRCLDEFDVYMDSVNREFVMGLLIDHARTSNIQFILVTPNALPGNCIVASDMAVHRLRDPERNQLSLI